MKKIIFLLLLLVIFVSAGNASPLQTYYNNRFNYSINYPSDIFTIKNHPANGGGIWLSDKTKKLKLTLIGRYMVTSKSIKEAYTQSIAYYKGENGRELTYKRQKDNWFVLSGYTQKKKKIFYEKKFCIDDKLVGYIFEYPAKDKKKYEALIKIFNYSFEYGK